MGEGASAVRTSQAGADGLGLHVDRVLREIERTKTERGTPRVRSAMLQLAAIQTVKRLRMALSGADPSGEARGR